MTDASTPDSPAELIGTLIGSFFAALKDSPDPISPAERPAEIAYELDQVVSAYLDEHELSAEAYHQIEQDVLNTIASDLHARELEHPLPEFGYDADGKADPLAVLSALDDHFDDLLSHDTATVPDLDLPLDSTDFSAEFSDVGGSGFAGGDSLG